MKNVKEHKKTEKLQSTHIHFQSKIEMMEMRTEQKTTITNFIIPGQLQAIYIKTANQKYN